MTKLIIKVRYCLIFLLILAGCRSTAGEDDLKGQITLWHSWAPSEAVVLQQALTQFETIHPHVNISMVTIPNDQIYEEFVRLGRKGLGPSVVIGNDNWINDLTDSQLIQPFSADQVSVTLFNARNRSLSYYDEEIYGLPMSLSPYALYYNENMVETVPETLDDLLIEAAAGNRIAFVPRFYESYWGIQTFGKGLFDENGQFTLSDSGFVEWLEWLDSAQSAPGVILNQDDESLMTLFATGQVAYYVGDPEKQASIRDKMDEDNPIEFSVAPLPQGPVGSAGPLLTSEMLLLYAYTADGQTKIANELANFLVNQQQSIRFLRELGRVPANPTVSVDRRIYPIVNGFSRQAVTAVVLPNEIPTDQFITAGNLAYITVLSGAATPEEAVCQFGQEVVVILNQSVTDIIWPDACEVPVN